MVSSYNHFSPCFFLGCKANARVKPAKAGHDALSSNFCVVLCIVCYVLFCVLFVCICVLYYCHRVATQMQLNISYHISCHVMSCHKYFTDDIRKQVLWNGNECGKNKIMRISRQPFPVKIMIDQKQLENMESFKYLGSILTNDGRCTCEIKCRIAMSKGALNKKRTLFTSTLDLGLRKKLVKCYIWSIALYGAETWTLRAVDQKHLERFEMWCWRRMEKMSWTVFAWM